jgi:hypothetical protein
MLLEIIPCVEEFSGKTHICVERRDIAGFIKKNNSYKS